MNNQVWVWLIVSKGTAPGKAEYVQLVRNAGNVLACYTLEEYAETALKLVPNKDELEVKKHYIVLGE